MKNKNTLIFLVLVLIGTSLACTLPGEDEEDEEPNDLATQVLKQFQTRVAAESQTAEAAHTQTAQASITPTLTFTPSITPSATPTSTPTFIPVPPYTGPALLDVSVPGGDGTACNSDEALNHPGSDITGWQIYGSNPAAPLPPGYWLKIELAAPADQTWMTCDSCFVGLQDQAGSDSPTGAINENHEGERTTARLDESGQIIPGTEGYTFVDGEGVWFLMPGNVKQFRAVTGLQPMPGDTCGGDEIPWTSVDLPCIGSCP